MKRKRMIGWIALSFCIWTFGQNDMIANINLQFRFSNPGARALALGGAFTGLADDTTAVFANPAGLVKLRSHTVAVQLDLADRDNTIPFFSGTIRQTGLQDFAFDLEARDFPESTFSVPFVCYVNVDRPVKWGLFYAEQANFKRSFDTEYIYLPHESDDDRPVANFTDFYFFPSANRIDLKLRSLGVSAAYSLDEHWSVGGTLNVNRAEYDGRTDLLFPDVFPPGHVVDPYENQSYAVIDVTGSETVLSTFLGLLYAPSEAFSVGLAYKKQPRFDYETQVMVRDLTSGDMQLDAADSASFQVPSSYGGGVSFKPNEVFLIAFDIQRVLYSQLSDEFHHFFDLAGYGQTISDTTEYHVGIEYFLVDVAVPLALRAGYWFEPYHALKNTFLDTQILYRDESGFQHIRNAVFLQQFEEDTNHMTLGVGINLTRHSLLDFGLDHSSVGSVYSLSAITRF